MSDIKDPWYSRLIDVHRWSDHPEVKGLTEKVWGESFNAKLMDKLLNREIFYSLAEARIVIEGWRQHYKPKRPHSSLGDRPPAPEAVQWQATPSGAASLATPAVAPGFIMH
jgi:transposase InsO family protein